LEPGEPPPAEAEEDLRRITGGTTRLDDLFRFWFVPFFEPAPLTCPCKFAADAAAAADAVFGKLGERPLEDAAVDPPGLRLILTP